MTEENILENWEEEMLEILAENEHRTWATWMNYLIYTKASLHPYGLILSDEDVGRWKAQIDAPYAELSEVDKDKDRKEVYAILPFIKSLLQAAVAQEKQRVIEAAVELYYEEVNCKYADQQISAESFGEDLEFKLNQN